MDLTAAITNYLRCDIVQHGIGRLYDVDALISALGDRGTAALADDIAQAVALPDGVVISFRGGYSNVPVSLDKPNRKASLHQVAEGVFSLDTEGAVQAGLQQWFRRQGYVAKQEVSDSLESIERIARTQSLAHLPDQPASRSTRRRDIMAHSPASPTQTCHIIEVKGRTQLEADFYETFGQVFPVADPAVTKGWTINSVPKHGWCLRHAKQLLGAWSQADTEPLITLVVAVPDFPPPGHDIGAFYGGETRYYPVQAQMYADFLRTGDLRGDHTFARLLRHLRDEYGLLDMAVATHGLRFRLWGYQGLNWVRDFASNEAVNLG